MTQVAVEDHQVPWPPEDAREKIFLDRGAVRKEIDARSSWPD